VKKEHHLDNGLEGFGLGSSFAQRQERSAGGDHHQCLKNRARGGGARKADLALSKKGGVSGVPKRERTCQQKGQKRRNYRGG